MDRGGILTKNEVMGYVALDSKEEKPRFSKYADSTEMVEATTKVAKAFGGGKLEQESLGGQLAEKVAKVGTPEGLEKVAEAGYSIKAALPIAVEAGNMDMVDVVLKHEKDSLREDIGADAGKIKSAYSNANAP